MVTLAQLQQEPWWNAEVAPPALRWLAAALCTRYRRPAWAAGIKGDEYHLRGAHRSRAWILGSAYCTNRTYTVASADDQAGDPNWCAGLDFTPGDVDTLIGICRRLDAAARAGACEEVSEWYGTLDGDRVDGWDNVRDRAATSDTSHLWHVHITVKRRWADDLDVARRLYQILTGDEMTEEEHRWAYNADRLLTALLTDADQVTGVLEKVGDPTPVTYPLGIAARLRRVETALVELAARPPVDTDAVAEALRPHLVAAAAQAVREVLGALDGAIAEPG